MFGIPGFFATSTDQPPEFSAFEKIKAVLAGMSCWYLGSLGEL